MTNPLGTRLQLHNLPSHAPRPIGPRHDPLHMMPGLINCWCMCAKCFLKYPTGVGICICRDCPCAASYEATKPIYVPYAHRENPNG